MKNLKSLKPQDEINESAEKYLLSIKKISRTLEGPKTKNHTNK
tara:strand:- start:318 stop:446 length:129 start_codon:yes stop_codon:yes gene_type:complete